MTQKQDKRPFLFPVIATAATDEQLRSPYFKPVLENWLSIARRVVIAVGRDSSAPVAKGVRVLRMRTNELFLRDVVVEAVNQLNTPAEAMVLIDPMCQMRLDLMHIFQIAKKRSFGASWVAASLAVALDEKGDALEVENEGLRWFCSSANVWNQMAAELPSNVPFTHPVWSGTVANWCSRRIHYPRYHDVTSLYAVARLPGPTNDEAPSAGWGTLTFNPPVQSYVENLKAKEAQQANA